MITLVDSPVLLPILVIIITIGTLALLYCSSYYAFRGGDSSRGAVCGAFCVYADNSASYTSWRSGAALSFKLIASYYSMRGGGSLYDDSCGPFFVYAGNTASDNRWRNGAALS